MNALGRVILNSPARAVAQRRYVVPTMARLGGSLRACHVLEIGCGSGRGIELLLDSLHAEAVEGIDIDPVMVRLAARRLSGRATVSLADMVDSGAGAHAFDAVVDMGAIHLEPRWDRAVGEVSRVLKPGGRFFFEEIVRPTRQTMSALATGRRPPSDFTRDRLLDALTHRGFTLIGVRDVGPVALTGVVGDVIGVARAAT